MNFLKTYCIITVFCGQSRSTGSANSTVGRLTDCAVVNSDILVRRLPAGPRPKEPVFTAYLVTSLEFPCKHSDIKGRCRLRVRGCSVFLVSEGE